jgi:hypothetical protein
MKPHRDASALAASLRDAAAKSIPLPQAPPPSPPAVVSGEPAPAKTDLQAPAQKTVPKPKVVAETTAITLRPDRELLNRYTIAAAERTKKEGKVISAQQMMLEVLERGMKS